MIMKHLKALLVEDSKDDAALLLRHLSKEGYDVQSELVQTAVDMKAVLAAHEWDIVLSDYVMPGFTGLDALATLKESGLDIPIIIISGTIGEEVAVEAMLDGVNDYLMKGNLTRLAPAIERELENAASRRVQKKAEEALHRSEENLANAQRIAHIGSWERDLVNNRLFWSDEVYRILGVSKDDFSATLESFFNFIHPEDRLLIQAAADAAMSGNAPYNIEHRIVRPDGEERVVCAIGEVTFDESGKPVRLIGTVQDITERKAAETEMRLMKSAIDSIVEGIVITDAQKPDNPIIYTNAGFEKVKGYTLEEIKGQNCRFLQGAETNQRTVDEIREALKQETSFRGEILNYRKNGESFWNDLSISPVFDQSGRLTNFVGVQQDISERKRTEKALHESEERFRSIVETTSEWIWAFDLQGNCSYNNPALETILGYAPEEIVGKSFLPLMHEEEREKIQQLMPTLIADKCGWTNLVLRWYHKDGRIRYLESNALPVLDSGGEVIGYRGSDRDITESRRAEEKLRQSETNLAAAQRITHLGSWEVQLSDLRRINNNKVHWSDEVYRIFGYQPEQIEVSINRYFNSIHPDDRKYCRRAFIEAVLDRKDLNIEFRVILPNGSEKILHGQAEVIYDERSNQPLKFIGTVQDITERKHAEEKIRERREWMRAILDGSRDGIVIEDGSQITYINKSYEQLLGYGSPKELVGKQISDLLPADEAERMSEYGERRLRGEEVPSLYEFKAKRKDGNLIEVEGAVSTSVIGGKKFIMTAIRDITERKRAEEALEQSERDYRTVFEQAHDAIIIFAPEGEIILDVNRRACEIYGFSRSEFIGMSIETISKIPANGKDRVKETLEVGEYLNFETVQSRKDGSEMSLEINASTITYQGRQAIISINRDITDRKLAEDALRLLAAQIEHQHERLNNVIANVSGVVWEAWGSPDAATQRIDFVSEYVETMLGYTVEEWLTTPNFWLSIVHPEDKERIAREATGRFLTGNGYTRQFRWVAKDGQIVWVESQATVIRDESGQSIGLRGINIDITERRRLEEERAKLIIELASEKARLQHIFDNSPSFIVSLRGPNFIFESANPSYYQLVGQRDLIGLPASEALPELITQDLSEMIRRVYSTGEPFIGNEIPVKMQPQDGSEMEQHYINFVYMPLREADNSISGIVSYGMDVTEQMLSRIKIQESEERYRLLFENNPIPMWVFDVKTLAFLSVNNAAIQHYGYSEEEFLTMNLKDIRPPEEIDVLLEHTNKSFPEIDKAGVFKHRNKNGTIIEVEIVSKQLIFNGKNAELVLANDVTERKKAEESIRFQAHLLNTVEQAVIATDLDGIVTYWNQFAEKLYGWTIAEAVGRNIRELTTAEMNKEQADQIMTQLSAGKSWSGEFTVRNKDGEGFPAYVSNSPVIDSDGKITGIVGVSVDITESSRAEKALRQAEDKYRTLVETSPAIIYLAEPHPPFATIYVSPNVTRFGYPAEEWSDRPDMWVSLIHDEDRVRVLRTAENAVAQGEETDMEYRVVAKNGAIIWLHDKGRFILDEQGNKTGWQGMMIDITKTKELEEQLRQSQKLESVGRLAGGIAHDFNNMLTAINGYSELTLRKLEADNPLRRNIEEIKKAGERSALLTHQLLAFSRRQVLKPVVLDLNDAVTDTIRLLQRLIGEDVELVTELNPKTGRVNVDPGQLSQIIVNLAVNARDAMPHGGKLTIGTSNVFLMPDEAKLKVGILPGAYVALSISDTGCGIDEKNRQHIFEPFFTTKEPGKGTGLGLATVYGIVQQSGGNIEIDSIVEVGTTFRIYLPRVGELSEAVEIKDTSAELPTGTETILLVEDEDLVRNLSIEILETCGYTVIEARNGLEALKICEAEDCKFDLLMTDVVMPQMGGRELAEKLTKKLPNIQVLFTSGYTDDAVMRHGVIETNTNFIQKPFTFDALASKIRELLDA